MKVVTHSEEHADKMVEVNLRLDADTNFVPVHFLASCYDSTEHFRVCNVPPMSHMTLEGFQVSPLVTILCELLLCSAMVGA